MDSNRTSIGPCALHEMENCGICSPPSESYRRGRRQDVPEGHYLSVRGGKGVYHHPDCYNVTGEWSGAETATLGERIVHSADELVSSTLRPAECCNPPLFTQRSSTS